MHNPSEQQLSAPEGSIEHRLRLLRELAGSLECARGAVLRSDLGQLKVETARQRELCAALGQLTGTSFSPGERLHQLRQHCRDMEMQVVGLNREYGALLARARRTVDIFCRLLSTGGTTYLPPKPEPANCHRALGA
jgi:hypothetical protein